MEKRVMLSERQKNRLINETVKQMLNENRLNEWKWLDNLATGWGDMKRSYYQARYGQNPVPAQQSQPGTGSQGNTGAVTLQSLQQTLLQAVQGGIVKGQNAQLAKQLYQAVSNQLAGIKATKQKTQTQKKNAQANTAGGTPPPQGTQGTAPQGTPAPNPNQGQEGVAPLGAQNPDPNQGAQGTAPQGTQPKTRGRKKAATV